MPAKCIFFIYILIKNKKVKRDILERGREIQGILYQYHRFVRPAHNEFVQPVIKSLYFQI